MKLYTCFLGVLLIVFGCQSGKKDNSGIDLNTLQSQLASKKDSITLLTAHLKSLIAVENINKIVVIESEEKAPLVEKRIPSDNTPIYKLYQKPTIREIKNFEFAEVISSTDTTATFVADVFRVTATSVCNGPADPDMDYCNCSNFVYVVTATDGEYSEYQLFKIGPFYMPQFKGWKKDKEKPELSIEHDVKGKKRTDAFQITLSGVKQI